MHTLKGPVPGRNSRGNKLVAAPKELRAPLLKPYSIHSGIILSRLEWAVAGERHSSYIKAVLTVALNAMQGHKQQALSCGREEREEGGRCNNPVSQLFFFSKKGEDGKSFKRSPVCAPLFSLFFLFPFFPSSAMNTVGPSSDWN